jgi:DNA-directed RNA polymerase subunit K/omega
MRRNRLGIYLSGRAGKASKNRKPGLLMTKSIAVKTKKDEVETVEAEIPERLHTTDSIYRGIVLACLRSKQLIKGATPRIEANPAKRKKTSIAIQEVKQGLIYYELIPEELA